VPPSRERSSREASRKTWSRPRRCRTRASRRSESPLAACRPGRTGQPMPRNSSPACRSEIACSPPPAARSCRKSADARRDCQAGPELALCSEDCVSRTHMTSDGQKTADRGSIDGRLEQVKDAALGAHDRNPSVADEIGEAAGGIAGVLLGAGIGLSAGPVGTLIGGIAGAIGGWWTGRAIAEAAEKLTHE